MKFRAEVVKCAVALSNAKFGFSIYKTFYTALRKYRPLRGPFSGSDRALVFTLLACKPKDIRGKIHGMFSARSMRALVVALVVGVVVRSWVIMGMYTYCISQKRAIRQLRAIQLSKILGEFDDLSHAASAYRTHLEAHSSEMATQVEICEIQLIVAPRAPDQYGGMTQGDIM